jgi:hypothetical protein
VVNGGVAVGAAEALVAPEGLCARRTRTRTFLEPDITTGMVKDVDQYA